MNAPPKPGPGQKKVNEPQSALLFANLREIGPLYGAAHPYNVAVGSSTDGSPVRSAAPSGQPSYELSAEPSFGPDSPQEGPTTVPHRYEPSDNGKPSVMAAAPAKPAKASKSPPRQKAAPTRGLKAQPSPAGASPSRRKAAEAPRGGSRVADKGHGRPQSTPAAKQPQPPGKPQPMSVPKASKPQLTDAGAPAGAVQASNAPRTAAPSLSPANTVKLEKALQAAVPQSLLTTIEVCANAGARQQAHSTVSTEPKTLALVCNFYV